MYSPLFAAMGVAAFALSACSSGQTSMAMHSAAVGNVTVYQEPTGIYSPDGTEQMLFRFQPTSVRSLEERVALATASMERHRTCQWVETSSDMLTAMNSMEPAAEVGITLIAQVRC